MHRLDGCDRRDVRTHHHRQRRDLAGMVHADLEDAEAGRLRHARQRQRHAPMIVVGRSGRMGQALAFQDRAQGFLGSGLAHGARDRGDAAVRPRPRRQPERDHGVEHVRNGDEAALPFELSGAVERDHGCRRALRQCSGHEVMPIAGIALDGEEEIARLQGARVDGNAVDCLREAADAARRHRGEKVVPSQSEAIVGTLARLLMLFNSTPPGFGQSPAARPPQPPRGRKREYAVADDLAGLMALARDDEHVARLQLPHRRADGEAPVADLARARRAPPGWTRGSMPRPRIADCRRSRSRRRPSSPRSRPSSAACRDPGRRRSRRRRRACPSRKAAACPAHAPARRACGRSR